MTSPIAGTQGFLFCDLRGYAAFVERAGDRAAAELLETYRALVRSVIAEHDGAEIRTEGDSVYVVFGTASSAVDAGLAIVAASAAASTKERPLRVGVGIHAGETMAAAEGPVGSVVNIAARVCAKAQAGEVLVTDTVRSLTRSLLPYRFVGLGSQKLKGIGGVALYRVEATSAGRLAHLRRRLGARRRFIAGVALVAVLALVAGSAAWAAGRAPDCIALTASTTDVVARIDPTRNCVVQVIAVGRGPDSIVATDSAVWVANEDDWTVTRIDLQTRTTTRWIGTPGSPISLASHANGQVDVLTFDDRSSTAADISQSNPRRVVWIDETAPELFDVGSDLPRGASCIGGSVCTPADRAGNYSSLAATDGWTWIVGGRGDVIRLSTRRTANILNAPIQADLGLTGPHALLVGATGGTVFVADIGAPTLWRFDGLATKASSLPLAGTDGTQAMAVTATDLWLLRADGSLTSVDLGTMDQRTVSLDAPSTGLAVGADGLWLLDAGARTVRSVDPTSGRTKATVMVGGIPGGAVLADGSLWVTIHGR